MTFIVATNVERRPTGTPHARAKKVYLFEVLLTHRQTSLPFVRVKLLSSSQARLPLAKLIPLCLFQVKFSEFEGKVILVVNVASQCGFTDGHYKGLKRLHDILAFNDRLAILGKRSMRIKKCPKKWKK